MYYFKEIDNDGNVYARGTTKVLLPYQIKITKEEFESIEMPKPIIEKSKEEIETEIQEQRIADLEMALAEMIGGGIE